MIRRFYQNKISMLFSAPMTLCAFAVFLVAFMMNSAKAKPWMRTVLIILAVLLAVLMFFYYKNKIGVILALKKVSDPDAYLDGGAVDSSFILEDRMLAGYGLQVSEKKTEGITSLQVSDKGTKTRIIMNGSEGEFMITALSREEAQRFAACIQRKNPDVVMNIEPKGNGTLKELGAGIKLNQS